MKPQLYWQGIPVPYVAAWSTEEYSHIAPDRNAGGRDALFTSGARGEGEPRWAIMNEPRQREVVVQRRCQVCNAKIRGADRSFGMDVSQTLVREGTPYPLLREPPACLQCARLTLRLCPGTRRRQASGKLECYEVFSYEPILTILGHIPVSQGGTPELCRVLAPGQTCIGMAKAMLTRYRRLTFDELTAAIS